MFVEKLNSFILFSHKIAKNNGNFNCDCKVVFRSFFPLFWYRTERKLKIFFATAHAKKLCHFALRWAAATIMRDCIKNFITRLIVSSSFPFVLRFAVSIYATFNSSRFFVSKNMRFSHLAAMCNDWRQGCSDFFRPVKRLMGFLVMKTWRKKQKLYWAISKIIIHNFDWFKLSRIRIYKQGVLDNSETRNFELLKNCFNAT